MPTARAKPDDLHVKVVPPDRREARFLRKLTHDLRSPVAVSRTLLSVLAQGYLGPLSPAQVDLLGRADRRLAFLHVLVDDLIDLAIARTDTRATAATARHRVPLGQFVKEACASFEPAAREKGVTLTYSPSGEAAAAAVDPDGLDLVLKHLVGNAVKYTLQGAIQVSLDRTEEFAQIVVDDDGIGIPEAARPHLFEEFFRASNARAVDELGTGLGLAIVKAVVERRGGTVDIEGTEGRGTTAVVRLPLAGGRATTADARRG